MQFCSARACAGAVILAFVPACAGGGARSATSIPGIPAPGTLGVPGQQSSGGGAGGFVNDGKTLSAYAVTSNPSGQSFTVGGATYTTPATVTPVASGSALAIVFTPTGYSVSIAQVRDGPHTVFYNRASDSTGRIAVASLQAIRRRPASVQPRVAQAAVYRPLQAGTTRPSDIDPTRVAVRMSAPALGMSGRAPADVERAARSAGRDTLSATADRLRIVSVPAGVDVATFTRTLQAQPEVAEVTPIHRRYLLSRAATAVTDPRFNSTDQWYTFATGVNYAWSYDPGTGAKLAIVDTGIDDRNTDLRGQVAYQETAVTPIDNTPTSANGGNPTCSPQSGAATVVTPNAAQDDDGHGTNVAGIAIAKAGTAGFAGAAWGAQLLAFKIFPSQNQYCNNAQGALSNFGADAADEAQAIADAIAHGADVISLSLGAASFDTVEFNAVESAIAAGVTVVAAAGNSDAGSSSGTLLYPATYPGVISVGATALKDEFFTVPQPTSVGNYATSAEIVAAYSQYSPSLSVVAPGGEASPCVGTACDQDTLHWIENYSTSTAYAPADRCSKPSPATDCVALFNGTSMATPQVAATAAMLIAEAGGHKHLSPAQVKYLIESTADNINDPHQGHGRLNAYRALASLIRDTGAYSGPIAQPAGTAQLVAFAYVGDNSNKPAILDATFPAGVPVASDGTFRIADVPAATGTFSVAVWDDGNGDGVVDVGDQVGVARVKCSSAAACQIGTIALRPVTAGYYLP